jgi:hypothetical protein
MMVSTVGETAVSGVSLVDAIKKYRNYTPTYTRTL